MKKVRRSRPCISMNFCTEFSKAQVFSCVYRLMAICSLDALKRVFEEERNENKKGNSLGVTISSLP